MHASVHATALNFNKISQSSTQLEIAVVISALGVNSAPSLSTYDLDILFDPTHLTYTGSNFGDPVLGNQLDLFDFGLNESFAGVTAAGELNLFELSFDLADDLNDFQQDSFTLATLYFNILKTGSSQLQLAINALGDADGNPINATINATTITSVPIPAAFWMMFSAMAFLYSRKSAP